MNPAVYYFSGTGNSLAVARDVAEQLRADLIPIPTVIHQEAISPESDVFGIVFPVYYATYGGIPQIVKRFVGKLHDIRSKYIFAVCTYGSGEMTTLRNLDRLLRRRGGGLAARFSVNMPENIHPPLGSRKHGRMFEVWKSHAGAVCKKIADRERTRYDVPNVLVGRLYWLLNLVGILALSFFKRTTIRQLQNGSGSSLGAYDELLPQMDNSYHLNENCVGCGTCAKVCPVNNIAMIEGRPRWQHHCEFCLGCFHWCPNAAIESLVLGFSQRYHHPEVRPSDMMR